MGNVIATRIEFLDDSLKSGEQEIDAPFDIISRTADGRIVTTKFTLHVRPFSAHTTRRDKIDHSKQSKHHGNTRTR